MPVLRLCGEDHDVGDDACPACAAPFPTRCGCGGLIHAQIDWERGQELMLPVEEEAIETKCDSCHTTAARVQRRWEPSAEDKRRAEEIAERLTGKKWEFDESSKREKDPE